MIETAVVILNYNGEKFLRQFLPSVILYSQTAQIVVADNGSSDNSIHILEKDFPQVSIIKLDQNYGFCGGYNRALKQLDARYFVLLNSDVEVTPNWLDPIISLLNGNGSIAAVQPKILSFQTRTKFEYAGAAGGFIDSLGYPFCRGRIFNTIEEDTGQYNDVREIFWATGACLFIRSEVYNTLGGLDEDFFAHMEEIDLCWKINRTGNKVYYCGKSTVYHVGAGTLGYESARKTYLNFRNNLTMIVKHFNTVEMLYKLPLRILLDWVAAVVYLLKGQAGNFIAVIKAHIHLIGSIGSTYQKRTELRKNFPNYSKSSIYAGSIILDYYLKKKKRFNNPK